MGNKADRLWSKAYTPTRGPDEPAKAEKLRPWVAPANRKQRRAAAKLKRSTRACTAQANREQAS